MAQYTVGPGESWASIAGKLFGDQRQFVRIMQANPGYAYPLVGQTINVPDAVEPNPVITQDFLDKLGQLGQQMGVPNLWNPKNQGAGPGTPPAPTSTLTSANGNPNYKPPANDLTPDQMKAAQNGGGGNAAPAATPPAKPPTPLPFSPESGMRETLPAQWAQLNTPARPAPVKVTNPVKPDVFSPFETPFLEAQGVNMDMGNQERGPVSTYLPPPPPAASVKNPPAAAIRQYFPQMMSEQSPLTAALPPVGAVPYGAAAKSQWDQSFNDWWNRWFREHVMGG